MATKTEEHIMAVAKLVVGNPQAPVELTPQSDLEAEFKLTWVDKREVLEELEDQMGIEPPEDARQSAQQLDITEIPWVVADLAKYLDNRKRVSG